MKTFVQFLKEQAEASNDPQNQIERKKRAWVSSVEQFIVRAKGWLEESDRETKVLRLVVDDDYSIMTSFASSIDRHLRLPCRACSNEDAGFGARPG